MKLKVVRFESYPAELPAGKAVGFEIVFPNRTIYIDTVVEKLTSSPEEENQIIEEALEQLKPQLKNLQEQYADTPSILGKEIDLEIE